MKSQKFVIGGLLGSLMLAGAPLVMQAAPPGPPRGMQKVVPIKIRPIDPKAAAKVSWSKDIHPLMQQQCAACHAPGDTAGGLDVTTVPALLKGGRSGPSVIPGNPDKSPLVLYIRGLKTPQMPKRHKPLSEAQLHVIREWIKAGAKAH